MGFVLTLSFQARDLPVCFIYYTREFRIGIAAAGGCLGIAGGTTMAAFVTNVAVGMTRRQ
jgi:hypothetical protein